MKPWACVFFSAIFGGVGMWGPEWLTRGICLFLGVIIFGGVFDKSNWARNQAKAQSPEQPEA